MCFVGVWVGKVRRVVTVGRERSDKHMGRRGRQAAKQEGRRPLACTFMAMCVFCGCVGGQSQEGGYSG